MKKATIARFVIGLAAISAVGCSAETGAPEAAGVGQTSEALGAAAPSVTTTGITQLSSLDTESTAGTQTADMFGAASCKIFNVDHFDLVVAGGFKAAGGARDTILVYNPVANTWTWLGSLSGGTGPKLHVARGNLQAIQDPANTNKCAFLGGETALNGAASKAVDVLTVSGAGVYAIANGTDLNVARSRFKVFPCGTNTKIVAIGGYDNGTPLKSIEYGTAGGAFTNNASNMLEERYEFAAAQKPGTEDLIVAGGHTTALNGTLSKTVEIIVTNASTCASTPARVATTGATKTLTAPLEGLVAFYEGTTDRFLVAGGRNSTPAAVTTVDQIDANFTTATSSTVTQGVATLSQAVYQPILVHSFDGTNPANMLIGGSDGAASASTTSKNIVQQYQKVYGWKTAAPVARFGGVAELIDGVVYAAVGGSIAAGTETATTTVEAISP